MSSSTWLSASVRWGLAARETAVYKYMNPLPALAHPVTRYLYSRMWRLLCNKRRGNSGWPLSGKRAVLYQLQRHSRQQRGVWIRIACMVQSGV
jgi:hypothetical protein